MGRKTEKIKFLKVFNSSKPIIPAFHYSNIPIGAKPLSSIEIQNHTK
jgi:hypothetical protein